MSQGRRLHSALMIVLCVAFIFGTTHRTFAQQGAATIEKFTFEELGFRDDRVANGTVSTFFYEMPIPHSWSGVAPTFNLHFSHSTLLIPELSQMTVLYNDVPVADARLTKENEESGWLRVTIPQNILKEDKHQLKIAIYQRLSSDRCGDSGTEAALWSVIHKDSTVEFKVEQKASLDLSWFPEPFSIYGRKAIAPTQLTMVLPAQPSDSDLRAAGLVSAKLGQLIGIRMLDLTVSLGKMPATGHVVLVGEPEAISGLLDSQLRLPIPLDGSGFTGVITPQSDEGLVELGKRGDGSALLLISGMGELGVLRAGEAVADGDSLRLMSGGYTIVKESPRSTKPPEAPQSLSTLQELTNSGDQRVEGSNVEELNYCFRLPPNWEVGTEAMLDLHYNFSPNLWAERSSLSVRFNTTTVANTKLIASTTGGNQFQIPLPADRFVDGYNCLRFLYTLRVEQSECVAEMGGELWGEIDSKSTLFLPYTEKTENDWQPDMDQYPYPFNIDQDLSATAIILPNIPSQEEIATALHLAARLGSEARHSTLRLTLKGANAWQEQSDQSKNLLIIGSADSNSVAATLEGQPIELSEENDITLQVRNEIFVRQQSGTKLAFAELGNSPWASERAVLQLASNSDEALRNLAEVLGRNSNEESLDGNIVTVTEDNLVRNVDTLNRATQLAEVKVTEKGVFTVEPDSISTIRWFLIGGIVMLCVVGTILLILTIRERNHRRAPGAGIGD